MGGGSGAPIFLTGPEQRALIITQEEAWLLNDRVRDIITESFKDVPYDPEDGDTVIRHLTDCRPLALQIVRALRDLQSMSETSIIVSEEECWFLERRFRHNDREPAARTLLLKLHELILFFHPELEPPLPDPELEPEVEANADRTYRDAIQSANEDANPDEDAGAEPGTGDGA